MIRESDIVGVPLHHFEFPFHGNPRSVLASGSVPGREALSALALVSIRLLAGCNVFEAFAIAKRERSKVPFSVLRTLTLSYTCRINIRYRIFDKS